MAGRLSWVREVLNIGALARVGFGREPGGLERGCQESGAWD